MGNALTSVLSHRERKKQTPNVQRSTSNGKRLTSILSRWERKGLPAYLASKASIEVSLSSSVLSA
jgi:hypothetical protein